MIIRICTVLAVSQILWWCALASEAAELTLDADTLLLLRFDGDLLGEEGESPDASQGTSFEEGMINNSVHVAQPDGFVRYAEADNISASEGTIEFWFKPDWDGDQDTVTRLFFSSGVPFNRGMIISIDGANNLRFLQWGDNPNTPGVETGVESGLAIHGGDMEANRWYHLAATWKAGERLSLYRDGELVASREDGVIIDDFAGSSIQVGADSNGLNSAEGAFDELRISSRRRSDGEIQGDYYSGLGINALIAPTGLTVDQNNRTLVTESGAHRISVFDQIGTKLFGFGTQGTAAGQFSTPWDLATDATNNIFVVDSDNSRVQVFDEMGVYLYQFGSAGSAPGEFNAPRGIHIDQALGRVYVADTGNHRIQRFTLDGALDTAWAVVGIAGTTGVVKRDHTGFDGPTNLAVHPVTGQLYVTDFGNHRLEVFDTDGHYERSYLAIYRPNGLAFDSNGDLYIAGEDPTNGYTYMDGRLRVLLAGHELLGRHYTGGLDDLGRILFDVAINENGELILTDSGNARLVKTNVGLIEPVTNLSVTGHGTEMVFRWNTAQPGPSIVAYGANSTLGSEAGDPSPKMDHEVVVNGLSPGTRLAFSVSFPDSYDGSQRLTPVDFANTGAPRGQHDFLRLKAAGLIYSDTNAGPGFSPISASQLSQAQEHFLELSRFYWLNSGFRIWLDYTIVIVDRDIDGCLNIWNVMQQDLEAMGFGAKDDFDAVHATSVIPCGYFGGGGGIFGRNVGVCQWGIGQKFPAIHEVNHSLDSIYAFNSFQKYEFNHGIWAVPGAIGRDFSINGQIVRNMLPVNLTATQPPFDKVLSAPDADGDQFPDNSPPGLTNPLVITEATFGSSDNAEDTDGDGLNDRDEAIALVYHGTNPLVRDTDGDGLNDSLDLNPAYPISDIVTKVSPAVDGFIDPGEGWTRFTRNWGYENDALVDDSNAVQHLVSSYLAWDDNYFYIALEGPPSESLVYLDGGNDGWSMGPESYRLRLRNDNDFLKVDVNVGVPDLFRQIDNDGQFSEFYDSNPQFTKPYRGRTIFDHPDDGLGFPVRLVSESDLDYAHGGEGIDSVWELAIPWSTVTGFQGGVGKEIALELIVAGDRLFEADHAAAVVLTETASSIMIIKSAIPADGTDFHFTGGLGSFSLDDDANAELPDRIMFSGLPPGTYNVTEMLPPQWIAKSITCDDGSTTELESATARIELHSGEDVSCSFVNRFQVEVPIFSDGFE